MSLWGIAAGAASLVGSAIQGSSARRAARSQERAAGEQLQLGREQLERQREIYDDQTERFAPFLDAGTNALGAYQYELGLGDRPQEYQGISMSPAAQFALEQGRDTVEAGAAARGGLQSGATLSGLERLRQGMAAQDREQQLNRIGGLADMGQGAAGMQASAGSNFAQGAGQTTNFMGNALANRGDAQASGAIGVGNAFGGGLQDIAGMFAYQNALNQPQTQASQLAPTSSQRPRPRPF